MFTTVRYFIKTSIAFLLAGLLAGLYASFSEYVLHVGIGPGFVSAHTHVILVGSVMMMIMGVALWFFPRPEKEDNRYNPDLIRVIYWILTLSTAVRFMAQIAHSFLFTEPIAIIIILASAGQVVGIGLFFYSMWGRIRAVGSQVREARGEKF